MFNILYNKMADDNWLNETNTKAYTMHKNALKTHILSIANAIVIIVTNAGDAVLYTAFNFCFVVINKAT